MVIDMPMKRGIIHESFKIRQKHVERCSNLLMIKEIHTGTEGIFMCQSDKDMAE